MAPNRKLSEKLMDYYLVALVILAGIAVLDLVVGVSNDAVNFLNSSIGSRVAPRHIILIVASLGILAGVLFSSGMMEVARKGIFHPQFFTMPELITLFLAVMLADILILDLFNTYGLPTSTTVSIVFELLGAAVALSLIKILMNGQSLLELDQYINSAKALSIVGGIFLSVLVSFVCGAIVQYVGRLFFTFNYKANLKKFGGLWAGISFASICMLIVLKGAKGATFIPAEVSSEIKGNLGFYYCMVFAVSGVFFQILASVFKVNVLKPIVLIGTFSLALAFAANDLVNFVGVPIAAFHSYSAAYATSNPLSVTMGMLSGKVPTSNLLLFGCGVVMVLALWFSKKARTVSETELGLSTHEDESDEVESLALSRAIVRFFSTVFDAIRFVIPRPIRKLTRKRFDRNNMPPGDPNVVAPKFDLLRASTNLMVASIVVSFATSMKLPLSTTYVTFMVSMGSSFADQAWGRDTAVYRITGVLTVIGGWFMTGIMAFTVAGVFCAILFFGGKIAVFALVGFAAYMLIKTHLLHAEKQQELESQRIYNLKKITDAQESISITFRQTAVFIEHLRSNLSGGLEHFLTPDRLKLKVHYRARKQLRSWSNVIAANTFKAMRLLHREQISTQTDYPQILTSLHSMSDTYRDTISRSYSHVSENHKKLLSVQGKELSEVEKALQEILLSVERHLAGEEETSTEELQKMHANLNQLVQEFAVAQNERIHGGSSKTRLSIVYFALMGNMQRMARQCLRLFEIFQNSLVSEGTSVAKVQELSA